MSAPLYDIEADWYLLDTCNYRCDYCFSSADKLGRKLSISAEVEQWRSAFEATGLTWLLHLTGGEPTLYPGFADLAGALTERHFISLNSNMTGAEVPRLAARVAPARVSFINAGMHLEERTRKQGAATFVRNVGLLRDRGFPIFVSLVATPEALERAPEAVAILQPLGMLPVPKLLRGTRNGKRYPRDYTEADRLRFRELSRAAREAYAPLLGQMAERPTIDPFLDDGFLFGTPTYTGRTCQAGRTFVSIGSDGQVYRCSRKTALGNILKGSLTLLAAPRTCDTDFCFYFCEKYSKPASQTRALLPSDREQVPAKCA
jgi:MoaA/NifB/PqqE/SkfB family radical SAM enzyme